MGDQFVPAQLFYLSRRAVQTQILRRGAGDQPRGDYAARDQVGLPYGANANRKINFLGDEVDAPVIKLYLQLYIRITRLKTR